MASILVSGFRSRMGACRTIFGYRPASLSVCLASRRHPQATPTSLVSQEVIESTRKPQCMMGVRRNLHTAIEVMPNMEDTEENRLLRKQGEFLELPLTMPMGKDQSIIVNRLQESQAEQAFLRFQQYAQEGDGLSKNEFGTLDTFLENIVRKSNVFAMTEPGSGELLAVMNVTPSPLCRSSDALLNAGYTVACSRNKGIGRHMIYIWSHLAMCMGYLGIMSRMAINNQAMIHVSKKLFCGIPPGIIPNSSHLEGVGLVDDIIIYQDLHLYNKKQPPIAEVSAKRTVRPPREASLSAIGEDTWACNFTETNEILSCGAPVTISRTSRSQKLQVEDMIRRAALRGDGFGMDEFTPDGTFNRKFFKRNLTLAARDQDGEMLASMILGPSSLCRDQEPSTLHMYIIVEEAHKLRGIEDCLFRLAQDVAKSHQYKYLFTDVYMTDQARIIQAKSHHFVVTASFPYCGYLQGAGYTDSLLFYKQLTQEFSKPTKT